MDPKVPSGYLGLSAAVNSSVGKEGCHCRSVPILGTHISSLGVPRYRNYVFIKLIVLLSVLS